MTNQAVDPTEWNEVIKTTKKDRSGCFFIQNNTWPNEKPAPGEHHACNDSIPESVVMDPLAPWLVCAEHIHQSDFWEQTVSCGGSEKPDGCSHHYHQGCQSHPSGCCECGTPSETNPQDTLEKLDEMQGIQQTKMMVKQRKKLLLQQLDLSGLDKWSDGNQAAAQALLAAVSWHLFPGTWRVMAVWT